MNGQLPQFSLVSTISLTFMIIPGTDTLSVPWGCLQRLAAALQQLDNSLFEKEACKWETGLEEGRAHIHDNTIYAPGSSHAKIV